MDRTRPSAPSTPFEEQMRNLLQGGNNRSDGRQDLPLLPTEIGQSGHAFPDHQGHGFDRQSMPGSSSASAYPIAPNSSPHSFLHSQSGASAARNGQYSAMHWQGPAKDYSSQSNRRSYMVSEDQTRPSRQQKHRQVPLDPNAYSRGEVMSPDHQLDQHYRPPAGREPYNPDAMSYRQPYSHHVVPVNHWQSKHLDQLAWEELRNVAMGDAERVEKEAFRRSLEVACREVCAADPARFPQIALECFGSFQSGFATAGSDMDLVIVTNDQASNTACFSLMEEDLPRALEKQLLTLGYGARLLSRTRVPIIKVCEKPDVSLLGKLREERRKWEIQPLKEKYPHLYPKEESEFPEEGAVPDVQDQRDAKAAEIPSRRSSEAVGVPKVPSLQQRAGGASVSIHATETRVVETTDADAPSLSAPGSDPAVKTMTANTGKAQPPSSGAHAVPRKVWTRERKAGPLEFPKSGVGVQTDINFFNPLGLHNTQLLRCYSLCDSRVRPIVLFVKAWAKKRRINSSYHGTLSSYGYVLMVLHYLVNVARPPVLPNLQSPWRPHAECTPAGISGVEVDGWAVDFWREEDEIAKAIHLGMKSPNTEGVGTLLAGFFRYYAATSPGPQFRWTQAVLSLRTVASGVLSKADKGWVKASTEHAEGKKIQNRYLFCIEDPFELNHNVARTVTHSGIVAIRDEFRRVQRILTAIGSGSESNEGGILDVLTEEEDLSQRMAQVALKKPATAQAETRITAGIPTSGHGPPNSASIEQKPPPHNGGKMQARPPRNPSHMPTNTSKRLDVTDTQSFPALAPAQPAANPQTKKPSERVPQPKKTWRARQRTKKSAHSGEISGTRAEAHLETQKKPAVT